MIECQKTGKVIKKSAAGASEKAQHLKVLAAQPDSLMLVPGSHKEGENLLLYSIISIHTCTCFPFVSLSLSSPSLCPSPCLCPSASEQGREFPHGFRGTCCKPDTAAESFRGKRASALSETEQLSLREQKPCGPNTLGVLKEQ